MRKKRATITLVEALAFMTLGWASATIGMAASVVAMLAGAIPYEAIVCGVVTLLAVLFAGHWALSKALEGEGTDHE